MDVRVKRATAVTLVWSDDRVRMVSPVLKGSVAFRDHRVKRVTRDLLASLDRRVTRANGDVME